MRLLHEDATARHLGLLRIVLFGAWIADLLKDPIASLSVLPFEYFQPIGVMRWVPLSVWETLHTRVLLQAWWAVLLVLLLLSALGMRFYRLIAVAACVVLTFYLGMIQSFTEKTHAELAALYVTWILAIFPAADALSLRPKTPVLSSARVYQAGLLLATVVLLSTYTFVAVRRLTVSGLGAFFNGAILYSIADRSATPDHLVGGFGLIALASPMLSMLLQIGFPLVTVFELLSLLCLSSRPFRIAWLAVILTFHILSWPLMQTLFLHNLILIGMLLMRGLPPAPRIDSGSTA